MIEDIGGAFRSRTTGRTNANGSSWASTTELRKMTWQASIQSSRPILTSKVLRKWPSTISPVSRSTLSNISSKHWERYGQLHKGWIITVPAVRPDKSKARTLGYIKKAGMEPSGRTQIVAEPEAAGIFALENMRNIDLAIGDTFVVCDAGGGYV